MPEVLKPILTTTTTKKTTGSNQDCKCRFPTAPVCLILVLCRYALGTNAALCFVLIHLPEAEPLYGLWHGAISHSNVNRCL